MTEKPVLYSYWRSSCSWRVRIALAIKGVDYEYKTVNLLSKEDLNDPEFVQSNPAQKVPVFVDNGHSISESLAIIEYLEEKYPDKPLLPKCAILRAHCRTIFLQIAAGIQPLQNVSVLKFVNTIQANYGPKWCNHWITIGLEALEKMLEKHSGKYCVGDDITIADLAIPSMVYNAKRFNVDLTKFPIFNRINETLAEIPEFKSAIPDNQPDAGLNA